MVDWAEVYRQTYPDLVRYLYRRVWDADRARDLAQETFAKALGAEAPDEPRAWVFTIAANLARDEARLAVRRRRHLTLLKSEPDALAATPPDPLTELERAEREAGVRRALEALSERDREVLLLWRAGQSYTEIAAVTGLAAGAIGTTLSRARRRLVEAYRELESGMGDDDAARG